MIKQSFAHELLRGSLLGAAAALLSSIVLTTFAFLFLADWQHGFTGEWTIEGIGALLGYIFLPGILVSFGFSLVPAAIGGAILASLVRHWAARVMDVGRVGFLAGLALGAIAALIAASLSLMTVLWDLAEKPGRYIPLVLAACVVGAASGGLVGRQLSARHTSRDGSL